MPIRGLVFDFGGVLFSIRKDVAMQLERQHNLDSGVLYATLFEGNHPRGVEEAHRYLEAVAGRPLPPLHQRWRETWGLVDENINLIRALRTDYRTAMLSNAQRHLEKRLKSLSIYHLFDAVIISGEVGLSKPDPRIYYLVSERLGLPVGECLVIDDNEAYVSAARKLGMAAVHYQADRGNGLKPLLDAFGVHVKSP